MYLDKVFFLKKGKEEVTSLILHVTFIADIFLHYMGFSCVNDNLVNYPDFFRLFILKINVAFMPMI